MSDAEKPPTEVRSTRRVARGEDAQAEKRRTILDAALRVFARKGFHSARVADVAREAGVAYGLVYHYFPSKEAMLDELFDQRWTFLLTQIANVDKQTLTARDKLYEVASFIIDSYRYDPELMKVIIVEVTRAANSFGREHLPEIQAAYEGIATIVRSAQRSGEFKDTVSPEYAALAFYGSVEQVLSGWIFGLLPENEMEFARAKRFVVETVCGGLQATSPEWTQALSARIP